MKRLYTSILLIAIAITSMMAQGVKTREAQDFRLQAFRTLNDYERLNQRVNLNEIEAERFFNLFTTADAHVYNDLIGIAGGDSLNIVTYVEILNQGPREIRVALHNAEMGEITRDGDLLRMDVKAGKRISYKTDCMRFNSGEYYGDGHNDGYFDLVFHMVYDPSKNNPSDKANYDPIRRGCYIESIDGKVSGTTPRLTDQYIVVHEAGNRDRLVAIDGKSVNFDSNGLALYAGSSLNRVAYPDPYLNAYLVPERDACNRHFYILKYRGKHWNVRPWGQMAMGDFYKVTTNTNFQFGGIKSTGMEFGIDFGYCFNPAAGVRASFNIGAGMSKSNMKIEMNSSSFNYNTYADVDGDRYNRQYTNVTMQQEQNFSDLIVPAYFEIDIRLSGRFSMFFDAGAKLYKSLSFDTKSFSGNYRVAGQYSQYDNLVLDYQSGINGFTNSGALSMSNFNAREITPKSMTIDVFGRFGFKIPIVKTLSLDVYASYQRGIGDSFQNYWDYPLIEYNLGQGENADIFRAVTNITRQFISVGCGLSYRF